MCICTVTGTHVLGGGVSGRPVRLFLSIVFLTFAPFPPFPQGVSKKTKPPEYEAQLYTNKGGTPPPTTGIPPSPFSTNPPLTLFLH
jgi:hypothetical protein